MFAQLVSKIFNLCGHDPPTSQTDRQTTCDLKSALCTIVHRVVKIRRGGRETDSRDQVKKSKSVVVRATFKDIFTDLRIGI